MQTDEKPKLTLVTKQDLTAAQIYGIFFNVLGDEIEAIQNRAQRHFNDALEAGIDPQTMNADFALEMLGLAERMNVTDINGYPTFSYVGDDDGLCDCDDFE